MPMCFGSRLKLFITVSCVCRPRAALLPLARPGDAAHGLPLSDRSTVGRTFGVTSLDQITAGPQPSWLRSCATWWPSPPVRCTTSAIPALQAPCPRARRRDRGVLARAVRRVVCSSRTPATAPAARRTAAPVGPDRLKQAREQGSRREARPGQTPRRHRPLPWWRTRLRLRARPGRTRCRGRGGWCRYCGSCTAYRRGRPPGRARSHPLGLTGHVGLTGTTDERQDLVSVLVEHRRA